MIKHIIFDAFGTLFLVEKGASANAVLKHLNAFGHHPDADAFHTEWKSFYRKHTASFPFQTEREIFTARIRHFCKQYQVPGNAKKAAADMLAAAGKRPAYPDVKPVLDAIKGQYRLHIASNTDNDVLQSVMHNQQIEVDHVFTSETFRCYKPSPSFYDQLLHQIHALPEECLFIGDSLEEDVLAPAAHGMKSLYLCRTASSVSANICSLSSLLELHDYLDAQL